MAKKRKTIRFDEEDIDTLNLYQGAGMGNFSQLVNYYVKKGIYEDADKVKKILEKKEDIKYLFKKFKGSEE